MITRVWDMLQMCLHPEDGGCVVLTYNREEMSQGFSLMSERKIHNKYVDWPNVVVASLDENQIILNLGYEDADINSFTLDLENAMIDFKVGIEGNSAILTLSLMSFTLKIEEYDFFEEKEKFFYVDDRDWENAQNRLPMAAQNIADSIAEQAPESLEIIAKYMEYALECGSEEAKDWLEEYYRGDDGRYDAYC
ncbi:hypothetical protein [Bacteroides sp.]